MSLINAGTVYATLEARSIKFMADMKGADRKMVETNTISGRLTQRMAANEKEVRSIRTKAAIEGRFATDQERARIGVINSENSELEQQKKALQGNERQAKSTGKSFNLMAVAGVAALGALAAQSSAGQTAIDGLGAIADMTFDNMLSNLESAPAAAEAMQKSIESAMGGISTGNVKQAGEGGEAAGREFGERYSMVLGGPLGESIANTFGFSLKSAMGDLGASTGKRWGEDLATMKRSSDDFGSAIKSGFDGAAGYISGSFSAMSSTVETAMGNAGGSVQGALRTMQDAYEEHGGAIDRGLEDLGKSIGGLSFDKMGDDLNKFLRGPAAGLEDWGKDVSKQFDDMRRNAGKFWDALLKRGEEAKKGAKDAWDNLWKGIG